MIEAKIADAQQRLDQTRDATGREAEAPLGQLHISDLTTDRIDVHTAASQINDDHAEIEKLVTLAWTQAKEFVRKHEGAIC